MRLADPRPGVLARGPAARPSLAVHSLEEQRVHLPEARGALIGCRYLSCCPAWNHKSGYGYDDNREPLKNSRVASKLEGYGEQRKQKNQENQKN